MKKLAKILLFTTLLILLVGVVCAMDAVPSDGTDTSDAMISKDTSSVMHEEKQVIHDDSNILLDENPDKVLNESTSRTLEKKTTQTNTKQDNTKEVNNYQELRDAVYDAPSEGYTTIRLMNGSYNNSGTIYWRTGGIVLTIDGNGQTINGKEEQVFFIDDGASLVLKNITIKNATSLFDGGAIKINQGSLTVSDSTFTDNHAENNGGAIYKEVGSLTVSDSTFTDNHANNTGGAIYDNSNMLTVSNSKFFNNTATFNAAIHAGSVNLTGNNFTENKANNNETIYSIYPGGVFSGNRYVSTDINLKEISLAVKDGQSTFSTLEEVELNFKITPQLEKSYGDFSSGVSDITIYVNGEEYDTTGYGKYTLTGLKTGTYSVYFTSCHRTSNTVTFTIVSEKLQITAEGDSFEYYDGVNNKVPLTINDPSGKKGTITVSVKDGSDYIELSTYHNIKEEYNLSTTAIMEALENIYDTLSDSYTINVTYTSDNVNYTSTEFTLNIIKQRNTTITYDIINSTEGKLQINITVLDSIYQTPINDAYIKVTGDINTETTTGILTNTTITPGNYTINVEFPETYDYKASQTTINFTVEIDKDKIISELENNITDLKQPKATSISIDPIISAKYGDEINITGLLIIDDSLSLSNQPVTITFNNEEETVITRNGVFNYTTTAVILGENTITANYTGNDKYQASEATYTFEVEKANTYIEISELKTVKKGDVIAISGVIYDHNNNALANKVVRLHVNNGRKTVKSNEMGEFSFDYTTTRVGLNTVTATFEGNDYYKENTTEATFEVQQLSTLITIDPINTVTKGTKATFTGTLTDENDNAIANAQVKLYINGSPKTLKTDSEGRFTHTFTMNSLGENIITATYTGSTTYQAAETETTVEVVKAEAVITLNPIESVTKGDTVIFTGKLTDSNGKAIVNAQVKLKINGSQKTLRTNENGAFTHTFKMIKEGTNNITAEFNGNNDYTAAETNSTVEVIKAE